MNLLIPQSNNSPSYFGDIVPPPCDGTDDPGYTWNDSPCNDLPHTPDLQPTVSPQSMVNPMTTRPPTLRPTPLKAIFWNSGPWDAKKAIWISEIAREEATDVIMITNPLVDDSLEHS